PPIPSARAVGSRSITTWAEPKPGVPPASPSSGATSRWRCGARTAASTSPSTPGASAPSPCATSTTSPTSPVSAFSRASTSWNADDSGNRSNQRPPPRLHASRTPLEDPRPSPERLVEDHYDDLYRFLRGLTRHVQDAEDLAQRTLVRAYRALDTFDGRAGLRTWLHGIAYREFLNWHRGRRLFVALDPRRGRTDAGFDALLDRERLRAAIARLSPKVGAAFVLVEVQELSLAEAATALGVPVGTVKSRLFEARAALRGFLDDSRMETAHVPETL
ncbi:sigma-70 family RNA polymerase sigma factor, partial [bacterium]